MTAANGRATGSTKRYINGADKSSTLASPATSFSAEKIREIVAELEVPFDSSVIEWRVTNTAHDKARGQVMPYADQRAYTDRLNALFTPAGWTRKYDIHNQREFRTECRPEDRCEGAGHL